jgi:hypothetical protein
MKLGTNDIGSVYLGTNAVQKVYLGANEVWTSFTGLLDDYPNAAAAYSLRLLRSAYTGDAIRVRRASDNTEQDIGFVSNELDTSALTTFCSGTNGFVKTWYDQSGNGYDATQTTSAKQPQIVSSGSVLLLNNKPFFTGVSEGGFSVSIPVDDRRLYNFFVGKLTSSGNTMTLSSGNDYAGLAINGNTSDILARATNNNFYSNGLLISPIWNRGEYFDNLQNQKLITWDFTTNSGEWVDDLEIGYLSNSYFNPELQELIIYPSDQSTNRTGIETNINDFYSIY